MANVSITQQHLIERQQDMFRLARRDHDLTPRRLSQLARRDHDLTPRRLSQLARIPEPTIASWAKGTAMPAWALVVLACYLPDDLTSIMFEPAEKYVGSAGTDDDGGLAELDCATMAYAAEHAEARRDGVVTPMERARVVEKARRVGSVAMRVARAA